MDLRKMLGAAKVGSIVKNGRILENRNAIAKGKSLSKFEYDMKSYKFMSGSSMYVHRDEMNKASIGISGAYGISGISKLSATLSGYINHQKVQDSNTTNINYNAYVYVGREHIDIDNLSILEIYSALAPSIKNDLKEVLDKCIALINNNNESNLKKWSEEVDKFHERHGDGMVFGIQWGGYGSVELKITRDEEANRLDFGEEGSFSYASPKGSVTVNEAFSGNRASSTANIKVEASQQTEGACMQKILQPWFDACHDKAFEVLADKDILKIPTPQLEDIAPPNLTPLPFVKEKDEIEKMKDEIKKIKTQQELEELTWEKLKRDAKSDKKTTEFKEEMQQPAKFNTSGIIPDNLNQIGLPKLPDGPDDSLPLPKSIQKKMVSKNTEEGNEKSSSSLSNQLAEDYTPMGIWIRNWADTFPWLVRGYDNSINIDDDPNVLKALHWRTLLSDSQMLSVLYKMASAMEYDPCICEEYSRAKLNHEAKAFASIKNVMDGEDFGKDLKEVFSEKLGGLRRCIYETWSNNWVLRTAELGFGLLDKEGRTIAARQGRNKEYNLTDFKWEKLDYGGDPGMFDEAVKLFPLIMPDGKIILFNYYGFLTDFWFTTVKKAPIWNPFRKDKIIRNRVIVCKENPYAKPKNCITVNIGQSGNADDSVPIDISLPHAPYKPIEFVQEGECLVSRYTGLRAIPIPLKAAKGREWKGCSLATLNLGSMDALVTNLQDLKKKTENSKRIDTSLDRYTGLKFSKKGMKNFHLTEESETSIELFKDKDIYRDK